MLLDISKNKFARQSEIPEEKIEALTKVSIMVNAVIKKSSGFKHVITIDDRVLEIKSQTNPKWKTLRFHWFDPKDERVLTNPRNWYSDNIWHRPLWILVQKLLQHDGYNKVMTELNEFIVEHV